MSVIVVNKYCDSVQSIRLFDCRAPKPELDLSIFNRFLFQIYEPGIQNPILEITDNDISLSIEYTGYPDNIINIKLTVDNLKNFLPNPYCSDKIREYRIIGIDKSGSKVLIETNCLYIEDQLMGR